jgi:hypothetical protein
MERRVPPATLDLSPIFSVSDQEGTPSQLADAIGDRSDLRVPWMNVGVPTVTLDCPQLNCRP